MTGLPNNLIADTLNKRARRMERVRHDLDDIPRLHVSNIIKTGNQDFFCPREYVLRYMERAEVGGAGIPPKFALLYAVGHFYGDHIVNMFLQRNSRWAKYAWGNWTCVCGATYVERELFPGKRTCDQCRKPIDRYLEVDLLSPDGMVVGHADLIFCVNDHFYIYEFKSIDRADIVFDEINEPLGDHLVQASNYYYMLKSEKKRVSKSIRFVYVDRSMDGLYTKLPFREVSANAISADRLAAFYRRVAQAIGGVRSGVLPERVCSDINCGRAKQCGKAISCFYRTRKKIRRIP